MDEAVSRQDLDLAISFESARGHVTPAQSQFRKHMAEPTSLKVEAKDFGAFGW
jgi:hypothetical protein